MIYNYVDNKIESIKRGDLMIWDIIFSSLLSSGIILGIIGIVSKGFTKGWIDNYFNKKMAKYKNELESISEKEKFDFERKIHDFSLYSNQKHKIYPEIYKKMLYSKSLVFRLTGFTTLLTFEEYDENDLTAYMQSRKYPQGQISTILDRWRVDKISAISILRSYDRMISFQEANHEVQSARGSLFENELYLAEECSEKIYEYLNKIDTLLLNTELPDNESIKQKPKLRKEIATLEEEIRKIMRVELSIGYYEKEQN